MKKILLTTFLSLLLMGVAACGQSSGTGKTGGNGESDKTYKIGVTQIVEHPSLNAAFDGFKKALEDAGLKVEYDVKNANDDMSMNTTIARDLVNTDVDLIFANSTPSAQAVVSETKEIPIVFTSVTDAVGAKLIESMEKPGGNVTGTIDLHPDVIPNTVKFLYEELGARKVGMVYNSGEQNSRAQIDLVKEAAAEISDDLEIVEATVATAADVKQAAESLIGKVDSMYIITDNTVVSSLESVIMVTNQHKLPLMVGEFDSVRKGGLAAYGFEYYDIGYEAGQMAAKILKEEAKPADIPAQYPGNLKFVMNKETAETIELEIKDEWNAELE